MNVIYPLAKQRLIEWALGDNGPAGLGDLCIIGVTSAYVQDDAHEVLADVDSGTIVGPETVLDNVTAVGGLIVADNPTINDMEVGEDLAALIIYMKWAGDSLLLAYMDTPGDGTLPATIESPKGLVTFDAAGIIQL